MCITFIQRRPTSKTFGRRCINVIQIFYAYCKFTRMQSIIGTREIAGSLNTIAKKSFLKAQFKYCYFRASQHWAYPVYLATHILSLQDCNYRTVTKRKIIGITTEGKQEETNTDIIRHSTPALWDVAEDHRIN